MPLCPSCSSEVAKTDTHCMDCGADLVQEREKERQVMREMSQAARMGSGQTVVSGAAAGTVSAGDRSSDETRIRAFDKQEAGRLAAERTTAWVTSGLALIAGIALLVLGYGRLKEGGGFGDLVAVLSPTNLREAGFGALASPLVVALMMMGIGLAALLVGVGQCRLAMAASRAICQVRSNIKPEIVQVSTFTLIGLCVLSVFCAPLGIIVGLIFFFGRNPDLKGIGSTMMLIGGALLVLFGANMLWKLAEGLKASTTAAPTHGS